MAKIMLLFVQLLPIYDVIHKQRCYVCCCYVCFVCYVCDWYF